MNKLNVSLGLALVAILIAIGAYLHGGTVVNKAVNSFGSIAGAGCGGNVSCLLGDFNLSGVLSWGGTTPAGSLEAQASIGTCSTTATSTLFAVLNPFAATSTAMITMYGAGQATSTEITVATSTQGTGLSVTAVGSLVNAAAVATSTQFYLNSGQSTFLGSGQISAGTSIQEIVVGPNEYVGAAATSTYGGVGALNYALPALTSCTYKISWLR